MAEIDPGRCVIIVYKGLPVGRSANAAAVVALTTTRAGTPSFNWAYRISYPNIPGIGSATSNPGVRDASAKPARLLRPTWYSKMLPDQCWSAASVG